MVFFLYLKEIHDTVFKALLEEHLIFYTTIPRKISLLCFAEQMDGGEKRVFVFAMNTLDAFKAKNTLLKAPRKTHVLLSEFLHND